VEPVVLREVHVRNIRLAGGEAPVRRYIPELMADVPAGRLDPSPVMDLVIPLGEVPAGYAAMNEGAPSRPWSGRAPPDDTMAAFGGSRRHEARGSNVERALRD
jgi:hypothetical protein